MQKIKAEKADEQEDEKTPCAWTKKTIVEPDATTQGKGVKELAAPSVLRPVNGTKILAPEGITRRADEHDQDHRAQQIAWQPGHAHGPQIGAGESRQGGRQCRSPRHLNAARITYGGVARAKDAGDLVGSEERGREFFRQGGE